MSAKWYLGTGAQNDVVINTSIHLARNVREYPFPNRLSLPDKLKVNSVIKNAAEKLSDYSFNYAEMKTLSQSEVVSLAERHLVSPEFASSRDHSFAFYFRFCFVCIFMPITSVIFNSCIKSWQIYINFTSQFRPTTLCISDLFAIE